MSVIAARFVADPVMATVTDEMTRAAGGPEEALTALLGAENVVTDADERRFYSTDIYRRADVDAALVIRPGSPEQLAQSVRLCTQAGLAVIARGGGLSYTGGFLPVRDGSVIIDMRRMDRIVEINRTDMYVTVECGATWRSIYEALKPLGLRTPYFGPMSGYASTVGGALSQGSVFLGSTEYGTTADSVLGLDVVLADGSVVTTGSASGVNERNPFFRNYGPDLTGPFLHDCGALGIKARATLRLIALPDYLGAATFTFGRAEDLLSAMSEVSRRGLAAECYGADPYIWGMRLWGEDIVQDVKRLVGVVKAGRTMLAGVKDAVRIAATGRRALKDVEYAMNVTVDGRSQAEIDHALGEIRRIAERGREVEGTAPRTVRSAPFLPPNDILGPKGHRWAPSHGVAPHSRIVAVAAALDAFFLSRADLLERNGIEWGYVAFAIGANAVLIEPMLYWPDARDSYHERMIEPGHLAKLPRIEARPEVAEAMHTLRADLVGFWTEQGCAHLQIGKTYRYLQTRQPGTRALLEQIKHAVDPRGLVNPGALGLA